MGLATINEQHHEGKLKATRALAHENWDVRIRTRSDTFLLEWLREPYHCFQDPYQDAYWDELRAIARTEQQRRYPDPHPDPDPWDAMWEDLNLT